MTRALRLLLLLTAFFWFFTPASAQSTSPEAIAADFVKAWNSHDMKAFDRLFTDDALWVPVTEVMDEGRGNILKDLGDAHTTWTKTTNIVRSGSTTVRLLRPDVAMIFFHLGFQDEQGNRIPVIDRAMLIVVVKQADGWRIAAGKITKQHDGA